MDAAESIEEDSSTIDPAPIRHSASAIPKRAQPSNLSRSVNQQLLNNVGITSQQVLGSLFDQVVVIDAKGAIFSLSNQWQADESASRTMLAAKLEGNYLELCRLAIEQYPIIAREALNGLEAVLKGTQSRFEMKYACDLPSQPRWFSMVMTRLNVPEGGAIVTHRKISNIDDSASAESDRYREVINAQTELVCRYRPDTTLTYVNDAYCRYFGRPREQLVGHRFIELIPEVSRDRVLKHLQSLTENRIGKTIEHDVILPDGTIAWQRWTDFPVFSSTGRLEELQGIGYDVTDRKNIERTMELKETALRASYDRIMDLAGRLIVAQEGERTRIACELHDDFNQQIAGISISLSSMKHRLPESATELREDIVRLQNDVIHLSDEMRHLSHDLHPGVLQHAGLVPALKSRLAEFQGQYHLATVLDAQGDFQHLSSDTALCLYRVAQEALHNIGRHAGASQVRITLRRIDDTLELMVADNGRGFEADRVKTTGRGLGLISMEERVHFAGGALQIDSIPQRGTTLRVTIPLGEPHESSI